MTRMVIATNGSTIRAPPFGIAEDIEIDLETGTATGGQAEGDVLISIESIATGRGNDRLTGNNADNILRGQEGDDRTIDFDRLADILVFEDANEWGGGDDNLDNLIQATEIDDDGNLVITRPEDPGTITLEGDYEQDSISRILTNMIFGTDQDNTAMSDAELSIDEAMVMDLADSEGIHLPAPVEPQAPPSADTDSLSADQALPLADPLEPPPALALFDADLEEYSAV